MEVEVLREERIDKYLAEELGISRSTVKKMIDKGFVLVNGKEVKASLILSEADELFVKDGFIKEASFEAEDIPINIVYEDDDLLVINKKSGMVVHPGNGNTSGTLVNALMHYTKNLSNKEAFRPGIVHRIDKDTSGLMLVAKNDKAHDILAEGFKNKTIKREYIALVCGVIGEDSGVIDAPIGRDAKDRKKMCVTSENSKKAVTHFKVLKRYEHYTLLRLILDTGRTHQIRVHMKYIGHPVYNDPVYGKAYNDFGQFLHSASIDFEQPTTHEHLHFECDVPKEFQDFLDTLN
ncbi:MAG: RluA family pseudouridine synthase [Clostridiaceae bacterium]|nr:MAG: RluA family pseudouridine synthase [Clostridiaceae bacterium]